MGKRKQAALSDEEDEGPSRVAVSESPERPLVQTARRSGKKAKVRLLITSRICTSLFPIANIYVTGDGRIGRRE